MWLVKVSRRFGYGLAALGCCLVAALCAWAAVVAYRDGENCRDCVDEPAMAVLSVTILGIPFLIGGLVLAVAALRTRRASPPPAGWYPDPSAAATWRYWDGSVWTGYEG